MREGLSPQYLAGFFDGEGSVAIYRASSRNGTHYLMAQTTQASSPVVDEMFRSLRDTWGGSLVTLHREQAGKRRAWLWQIRGAKAVTFLEHIAPYLVIKRDQVDLAIEWYRSRPLPGRDALGRRLPCETNEYDAIVAEKIKALKG